MGGVQVSPGIHQIETIHQVIEPSVTVWNGRLLSQENLVQTWVRNYFKVSQLDRWDRWIPGHEHKSLTKDRGIIGWWDIPSQY